MKTVEGITEKLCYQADKELEREINQAFDRVENLLRDGVCGISLSIFDEYDGGKVKARACWYEMTKSLKKDAFDKNCVKWRQKKVDEFMAQVESLSDRIEELKGSIE